MKGLTDSQRIVLRVLVLHGGFWHKDCGWFWRNVSSTERVLAELEKKGEVNSEDFDGKHRLFLARPPIRPIFEGFPPEVWGNEELTGD